jgi:hypothetical protein
LIFAGIVLGTQRIGGADVCAIKGLLKQPPKVLWLSQLDQSTQGAIGIRGCRVDKKSGLIAAIVDIGIYPLSNTRSIVSAL